MPIPRYGSATALNRSGQSQDSRSGEGSMYSDRNSSMYRSSPDLFHNSKRRSSSTDSTDGSYHGSHSRQSSDSTEMYPTRRFSTQLQTRKASVSTDPLQFIKSKGAMDLALTAEEQMRLAAETKKIKFVGTAKDEDSDWQSNLNIWKNRRKSQSEKSYQLKEELEEMEREKEEPITATATTKTFSQIQEEREQRKSTGAKSFYPIEDEEEQEDDIFSSRSATQQESSPLKKSGSRFQSSTPSREDGESKLSMFTQPKGEVASWAEDLSSQKEEEEGTREENNNSTNKPSTRSERLSRFDRDSNNDRSAVSDARPRRSGLHSDKDLMRKSFTEAPDSAAKENSRNGTSATSGAKSENKISNILKSFEKKEEDSVKPRSVEPLVDVSARKKSFENSGARNSHGNVESHVESRRSWSTEKEKQPVSRNTHTETSSRTASTVYASSKHSGKDFVEKTIKISQKANNERGFGFTLGGGADKRLPVIVEKVGLGSAADVCELQSKDEVVAINGESIAHMTSVDLDRKVKDAVRVGQIELRVQRTLGAGGDFDDEDFMSSEEEFDTPDHSVSKSSSVRAENSFDSLDSRDDQQVKAVPEQDNRWIEEQNTPSHVSSIQATRRGDPTSTSSDSGYDAQTFSSSVYSNDDDGSHSHPPDEQSQSATNSRRARHFYPYENEDDNGINSQETELERGGYSNHRESQRGDYSNHCEREREDYTNNLESQKGEYSEGQRQGDDYSNDRKEAEIGRSHQFEVESRPVVTTRRALVGGSHEDDSKPLTPSNQGNASQQNDDFGPPAVLRKWQRQRPRTEYTFESDEQPPQFYSQIRLSSTLPRGSERISDSDAGFSKDDSLLDRAAQDFDSAVHSKPPQETSIRRFNLADDRKRMEDWNKKQEDERQPADVQTSSSGNAVEIQFPFDKRQFEVSRNQIQQQYSTDLQKASNAERQKQDQERQLLEPEMEKLRLLEERRAQRQARIKQYSQDAATDNVIPSSQGPAPATQHTTTWSTQLTGNKNTAASPGILVIDPRNRGDDSGQASDLYQFQLKINQSDTPEGLVIRPEVFQSLQGVGPSPADQVALLEAERERIRQVERERIRQEELQRIEEEQRQKEEEEMNRIRAIKEQLQQQQEMLRRKEEELRREQERFEKERQQLQQQVAQPPPQHHQQHHHQQQQHHHQQQHDDTLQFETVTSKVRGGSPAFTSTVNTGPRRSDGHPQMSGGRSRDSGSSYGSRRSEPVWDVGRNQNTRADNSYRGVNQTVSASQSSLPKWPPAGNEQRVSNTQQEHEPLRGQLSREDMLAMNRKATPLQTTPAISPTSPPSDPSPLSPIKREAPSKGERHSLNSVPKAKFRNPDGWISGSLDMDDRVDRVVRVAGAPDPTFNNREVRQSQSQPRHTEGYRGQLGGPQDHWLIQEAERRRLHDSGDGQGPTRSQFSGPIKPAADTFGNRWRDDGSQDPRSSTNMPAQIRQTLLQKTAGARGSTGSNYSQELNPPISSSPRQFSPNTSMSQTLPPNFAYDYGQPSRHNAVPPSHRPPSPAGRRENGMAVSGKQNCSHCDQELGFGAAMVIESLGLYYHVQCFRCCVCRTPLGNGVEGADVRVRVNKLHCPNCYSNDEGHADIFPCVAWIMIRTEI